MEMFILFGSFTLTLLMGIPWRSASTLLARDRALHGHSAVVVFQQLSTGMNAFAMLAIPFFIYSGDLMIRGGIADRLISSRRALSGICARSRAGERADLHAVRGDSGSAVADASASAAS